MPERRIQFSDRGIEQKQYEDPDLYGRKAVPGEVSRHVFRNSTEGSAAENVFDELFQEPHQEDNRPIDKGLEDDSLNSGSRTETAEKWNRIRYQH